MAIQTINLGTQPSGTGGDTNRSANVKVNENFSNPAHAASRMVGTNTNDVAEYSKCFGGAFGVAVDKYIPISVTPLDQYKSLSTFPVGERILIAGIHLSDKPLGILNTALVYVETKSSYANNAGRSQMVFAYNDNPVVSTRYAGSNNVYGGWRYNLTSANTTTDANGFIKKASPVIQLFSDKITANDEAAEQNPIFEKVDTGQYLVKGSSGFSQDGWYIEQPKDANGNVLVAVVYEQLENNDISVKTYKKKFDLETASIVADLDKPVDIPENRWIDLRLQELPQEEVIHEPEQ